MSAGAAVIAAVGAGLVGTVLHLLPLPAGAAGPSVPQHPIVGVDALAAGTVVESGADILPHWVQGGFRNAVLLHVGLHGDLRHVDDEKIAAAKTLRDRGDFAALTRAGRGGTGALYNEGNFVRAAAALGIVREMVWVVPFALQTDADAGARLADYLGKTGLPARDIETFRPDEGCFRGFASGLPVAICAQERLPRLGEPVLLSLDADFFLPAADARGSTYLTEVRALFAALRDVRYSVRDVVLSHSVQGGAVPIELRWIGEAVVDILRDPSIALQQEPPERWRVLQQLSGLRAGGREKEGEMLNVALTMLERQPHDPALLLFVAEASAGHGGGAAALAYAEQACRVDRGYCAGLREVGLQMLERGRADDAMPFLAAADRLQPGMWYGQRDLGVLLARAGRPTEAVAAFEALIDREGAFPGGFLAGAVHAGSGDRTAARRSYDAAAAEMAKSPYASVASAEVEAAIRGAALFYRAEGLVAQAERLERDARLRISEGRNP